MSYAIMEYNRRHAVTYARRWANGRNPLFADYTGLGGDCTNFISQCVLAGGCEMNFTPVYGWYYLSEGERTASWTGVAFFAQFLVGNTGPGPFASETDDGSLQLGDVIQLGKADGSFYHTLIVTGFRYDGYLVCAHTDDALDRPLSTYTYEAARFLHIEGVRFAIPAVDSCFERLMAGGV